MVSFVELRAAARVITVTVVFIQVRNAAKCGVSGLSVYTYSFYISLIFFFA